MDDVVETFRRVERKLRAKPWFERGKWLVSVHGFPRAEPQFITFHVFKKHWFNEDGQGIHIESYLAVDPKKRKKSYIAIHVLHHANVPGTSVKRIAIAKPFVDSIYGEVKAWNGYRFRAGKYGTQPFTKILDGSSPDFESALEEEVSRICRALGPAMDQVLAQFAHD